MESDYGDPITRLTFTSREQQSVLCYFKTAQQRNMIIMRGLCILTVPVLSFTLLYLLSELHAKHPLEASRLLFIQETKMLFNFPQYRRWQFIKALLDALELHQQYL